MRSTGMTNENFAWKALKLNLYRHQWRVGGGFPVILRNYEKNLGGVAPLVALSFEAALSMFNVVFLQPGNPLPFNGSLYCLTGVKK